MPGVGEQQQQEAEREAGQPRHQVHRAPAHRRGQVDAGGLGEAEPEVDREVEQPRGEAALPVPVEVRDEAHADGAAGGLPGGQQQPREDEVREAGGQRGRRHAHREEDHGGAEQPRPVPGVRGEAEQRAAHREHEDEGGAGQHLQQAGHRGLAPPSAGSPGTRGRGRCSPSRSRAAGRTAPCCWRRCSPP